MSSFETVKGGVNRYTLKCEIHGLHFNPEKSVGCVLCARDARRGAARKTIRVALVALAAAALLLASIHLAGLGREVADSSPSPLRAGLDVFAAEPDGAVPSVGLDPDPYRDVITQIESVLYRKSKPTLSELQQTAMAGRDLSDRIQRRENPVRAGRTVLKLLAWSSRSFELGAGYTLPDTGRARSQWESIRNGAFKPAQWFRSQDSPGWDPEPRPEVDGRMVSALSEVSNEIFHLIATGEPESAAIPSVERPDQPGADDALRRWERWRNDWNRRLQRALAKLPAPPDPAADVNMVLAYQKLNSALHYLSLVPVTVNSSGVPLRSEREKRFKIARSEAEEGERRLHAAGG